MNAFTQNAHQLEPTVEFDYDQCDRANPLTAELTEATRFDAVEIVEFAKRVVRLIKSCRKQMLAFDCMIMALGWNDLIADRTQTELAERYGVSRAAICKYVKRFQDVLNLPQLENQKTKSSRSKLSKAHIRKGNHERA